VTLSFVLVTLVRKPTFEPWLEDTVAEPALQTNP
jgi:hypothetical protein